MADTDAQPHPRLIELFGLKDKGFSAELLNYLPMPWDAPPAQAGQQYKPPPYLAGDDLVAAAWVALLLRQPLLLTGDPGVGKTRFAEKLANDFQLGRPTTVQVKSTTSGRDLLYKFDDLGRFRDATIAAAMAKGIDGQFDPGKLKPLITYVRPEGLGRAILRAAGGDFKVDVDPAYDRKELFGPKVAEIANLTLADVFPEEFRSGREPRHSVVLIDELDKAPRDTPNDLLGEIERMTFRFDELGFRVTAEAKYKPIVVITSNAERNLPDAFLRRCVFHHIVTPDEEDMCKIAAARLGGLDPKGSLISESWKLFKTVTDTITEKKPGTAEFIALVAYVKATQKVVPAGAKPPPIDEGQVRAALRVFAKSKADLLKADDIMSRTLASRS